PRAAMRLLQTLLKHSDDLPLEGRCAPLPRAASSWVAFVDSSHQDIDIKSKRRNDFFDFGMCDGVLGDEKIHVTVTPDNTRALILDGASTNGFVQSKVRCQGKSPELFSGSCDDPRIRKAWRCQEVDLTSDFAFPYVDYVMQRLKRIHCSKHMQVLMLGLGGSTMQSSLRKACPAAELLTVEASPGVVAAARRFFGFRGDVLVEDAREALKELARSGRRFDAIVVDIADTVLEKEDVDHLHSLLKDSGEVLQNHTNQSKMMEQLEHFRKAFPHVDQESFQGGNILMSYRKEPKDDALRSVRS
ncbi:Polyamine aminopropyltransferase (Putrescine aminopropyltransferase) (PAPT) (Spermidine synthase) (SPDS) (SPDSY), partial [Durusdinium trenchii]